MFILHIGIFSFLSAVCVEASMVTEVSGYVGGEVSIQCSGRWGAGSSSDNYNKFFCKGVCSSKNILIQAVAKKSGATQRGRYIMEVNGGDEPFVVTMKGLEKTDVGGYSCGLEKALKVLYQEINLKVLDAPTVSPGSPPSNTTLQTITETRPQEDYPSSAGSSSSSPAEVTPRSIEEGTVQPVATTLTDTTVVIIVSVSLALLVCAIIPLIFYGRWRSTTVAPNGSDAEKGSKVEADYNEGNDEQDVPSTRSVGLQTEAPHGSPESNVPDASQYASMYQALDPKALD